jgi:exopolysaccharide biosynthesis predicted pyruvyltransferase EpsI
MDMSAVTRRAAMFSELEEYLVNTLNGKKFVYLPDPGNAGDSFIAHATFQLFDRLGLDYEIGDELATYPDRIAVWGGGGNLVPLYVNLNNFLLANARHCERLIILPHTIYGYETTLAQLGPNCDIFCRDQMSLAFVRQHAPRANIRLSHDIAFSVNFDQTTQEGRKLPIPFLSDKEFARRNVKRRLYCVRYDLQSCFTSKVLNCFRRDSEKTEVKIPSRNIDVSAVFATGNMTRRDSLETTYRMMRFVDGFERVNTNRLHIAILSALLGKSVNFYANSYGKNQAVYEHSMANWFPNVKWCG